MQAATGRMESSLWWSTISEMALSDLAQIPTSPESFWIWSFANMAHHRDIFRAIYEADGTQLQEYAIEPFDPKNDTSFQTWLISHARMHAAQNEVLGIDSNNLIDLDWDDLELLQTWMLQHFSEHDQAAAILNLG